MLRPPPNTTEPIAAEQTPAAEAAFQQTPDGPPPGVEVAASVFEFDPNFDFDTVANSRIEEVLGPDEEELKADLLHAIALHRPRYGG